MNCDIHIVLVADNRYCNFAGAVIASVFKTAHREDIIHVHIVHDEITTQNKRKIETLLSLRQSSTIDFILADTHKIPEITLPRHISQATLYRLQLPKLLPQLDRVLYLDCDVIVIDSLSLLWNIPLDGNLIGAVCDCNRKLEEHKHNLGIAGEYINAGVLLMDLHAMRNHNICEEFQKQLECSTDRITMADQDIINIILQGKIRILDLRYNLSGGFFKGDYGKNYYSEKDIATAVENPCILHFTSARKPWTLKTPRHPFWELYFDAVKNTVYSAECLRFIKKYILPKARVKWPVLSCF
jgi:lipopolysaccharide biosynthesis glycosyltransferase